MREIIWQGCGGKRLTCLGQQAFGFGHFTLIGLVRGARQAE